jgi:diguanylate cyclase (GGDEF)-like protein
MMASPIETTTEAAFEPDAPDGETVPTLVGLRTAAPSNLAIVARRFRFVALAGANIGRIYRVDEPVSWIGRTPACQIRLQDEGVSRRHARLVRAQGHLWLEDIKSANGTQVNAVAVERCALRDGDKVQVGHSTILRFMHSDPVDERFFEAMYVAAVRDALTGAYNRRHFQESLRVEAAYARRHGKAIALLMLDLDHFKKINDEYGHPAGDHVLRRFAGLTQGAIRIEDLFARMGGEEFAIILRLADAASAAQLARRLCKLVASEPFVYDGCRIPVTVSIGVAATPALSCSEEDLVEAADTALYEAKRAGRNGVVVHDAPGAAR